MKKEREEKLSEQLGPHVFIKVHTYEEILIVRAVLYKQITQEMQLQTKLS